ncbi:MAG: hypothetical protein ABGY41_12630 [Candidatus Poribacteria bacterium]
MGLDLPAFGIHASAETLPHRVEDHVACRPDHAQQDDPHYAVGGAILAPVATFTAAWALDSIGTTPNVAATQSCRRRTHERMERASVFR